MQRDDDLAQLRETLRVLTADRDAKTEELRRLRAAWEAARPVLEASAAIPKDNLIAIASKNGRRMARWARAELARRTPLDA